MVQIQNGFRFKNKTTFSLFLENICRCTKNNSSTSMHSSRMRTARLLPVSPSMHCAGGCLLPGGSAPGRGVCLWSQGGVSQHAMAQTTCPCRQISCHTLLKILPCPNSVAGGNEILLNFEKLCVSKQERILVHYDHILVSFMCQNCEVPGITHNTEGRS